MAETEMSRDRLIASIQKYYDLITDLRQSLRHRKKIFNHDSECVQNKLDDQEMDVCDCLIHDFELIFRGILVK